jgi:phytoene synthase
MADQRPVPAADALPLPLRLALSYAPRRSRAEVLGLWQLDQRLAGILQAQGEVMIAQIKLAWWRDRLGEDPATWPKGEPLLAMLQTGKVPPRSYLPLVDGWEALLGEELTAAAVDEFAAGRAAAWQAVATAFAGPQAAAVAATAAREISYFDLARHLGSEAEAGAARQLAQACKWHPVRLPRALRPLAIIHALSRRALDQGAAELLDGPRAGLLALRIGLFGR